MEADTTGTTSFDASPGRMLLLALLGVVMTAASLLVAIPLLPNVAPGSLPQFVGWIGTVFFALCTVLIAWRALTMRGPVVVLSPDGIRDIRVSERALPWPAVLSIGTWEHSGQKVLVLALPDEIWQAIGPSRIARMTRSANAKLGADGYCITTQGMRAGFDDFRNTVIAYAQAHSGSDEASPA